MCYCDSTATPMDENDVKKESYFSMFIEFTLRISLIFHDELNTGITLIAFVCVNTFFNL